MLKEKGYFPVNHLVWLHEIETSPCMIKHHEGSVKKFSRSWQKHPERERGGVSCPQGCVRLGGGYDGVSSDTYNSSGPFWRQKEIK